MKISVSVRGADVIETASDTQQNPKTQFCARGEFLKEIRQSAR